MNTPDADDDLRQRFRELREEESAHAPGFERVRRGAFVNASDRAVDGVFAARPAWAAAVLLALAGGWWLIGRDDATHRSAPLPVAEVEMSETMDLDFPNEDPWMTATDVLLAEAEGSAASAQVDRLAREIAVLLQP